MLPGSPIAVAISLSVSRVLGAPPIKLSIAASNSSCMTASLPDVTQCFLFSSHIMKFP